MSSHEQSPSSVEPSALEMRLMNERDRVNIRLDEAVERGDLDHPVLSRNELVFLKAADTALMGESGKAEPAKIEAAGRALVAARLIHGEVTPLRADLAFSDDPVVSAQEADELARTLLANDYAVFEDHSPTAADLLGSRELDYDPENTHGAYAVAVGELALMAYEDASNKAIENIAAAESGFSIEDFDSWDADLASLLEREDPNA